MLPNTRHSRPTQQICHPVQAPECSSASTRKACHPEQARKGASNGPAQSSRPHRLDSHKSGCPIQAAFSLSGTATLILAAILGFLLDLMIPGSKLGNSVLILFSLSALITTQAQKPESHTWIFRLAFVVGGTFLFFVMTHVLQLVEAVRWYWPFAVWSKIVFGTLLNLILAPLFFYVIGLPPRLVGWRPTYEINDPYGHAR